MNRVPVTADDVARCVAAYDAHLEHLLFVQRNVGGCGGPVDLRSARLELAGQVAREAGRPDEWDHFDHVLGLVVGEQVSTEPELVECRTPSCGLSRRPVTSYAGTSCASCGRALGRLLGPVSAGDCPPWCAEHAAEEEGLLTHDRDLARAPGVEVWLEEAWTYDTTADLVTRTPPALCIVADETVRVPVTPAALAALRAALAAAGALLEL